MSAINARHNGNNNNPIKCAYTKKPEASSAEEREEVKLKKNFNLLLIHVRLPLFNPRPTDSSEIFYPFSMNA